MFWNWSPNGVADAVFAAAAEEHDRKQRAGAGWGLFDYERWDLDLTVGELRLRFADGRVVTAPAQVVGSFDREDETWHWAWDNPSINRLLTRDAQLCRAFGERYALAPYTEPLFTCAEEDAHGFAAVALHLAGAAGVFRQPQGVQPIWVLFGDITTSRMN